VGIKNEELKIKNDVFSSILILRYSANTGIRIHNFLMLHLKKNS